MYSRINDKGIYCKSFIYGLVNYNNREQAIVINPILNRFLIVYYL